MTADRKLRASSWAILAVMLLFTVIAANSNGSKGDIIRSDVRGYYGYLHALFITHDLGHEAMQVEYVNETPDGTLNKYFAGEAVLLLPFFLVAHAYVSASGGIADGFSLPYENAIAIAALVYALLGLLALRAVLRGLSLRESTIAILLLMLGFGTQLAQYTAVQPGWSHVYSFCAFAVFLLVTQRIAHGGRPRLIIAWGAVLGMIILMRPVNGLVLLGVPVLLGKETLPFLRRFLAHRAITLLGVLACMLVVGIQSLLWHAQIGKFVAYGYKGEGFQWDRPKVFLVLIGIRRGLFIWTPVLVAAAGSVVLLWKRDRIRFLAAMAYWAVITYVISSWWIWYYGGGFGSRVYTEHYAVLILPLALVLDSWNGWRRRAMILFLIAASSLQLAQFYQYNHDMIDHSCMDKQKYVYSFLHFDEAHRDRFGGLYECAPFSPNGLDTLLHERWTGEHDPVHWKGQPVVNESSPSLHHAIACGPDDEFGASFAMNSSELPAGRALYLAIGFERHVDRPGATRGVKGVITVDGQHGKVSYYKAFPMEPLPPDPRKDWEHIEYRIPVPAIEEGDTVKFYFWNKDCEGPFLLDDLDITVMAARPY